MTVVSGKQTLGQRDDQEDSFKIVYQNENDPKADIIMIVADGMGGHTGGEIASNLAISEFERHFIKGSQNPKPSARMHDSLRAANKAVGARIVEEPALKGMGCTILATLKIGDRLIWASVGDSILFLFRGGKLRRLNANHSLYGELLDQVRAGKITQAEADGHPKRNALRSAITGDKLSLTDVNSVNLEPNDVILLTTDGVETLSDSAISQIVGAAQKSDPRGIASDILNAVESKNNPRQDNSTLIVYRHEVAGQSLLTQNSRWKFEQSKTYAILGWAAGACFIAIFALLLGYYFFANQAATDKSVLPTPAETINNSDAIEGLEEQIPSDVPDQPEDLPQGNGEDDGGVTDIPESDPENPETDAVPNKPEQTEGTDEIEIKETTNKTSAPKTLTSGQTERPQQVI